MPLKTIQSIKEGINKAQKSKKTKGFKCGLLPGKWVAIHPNVILYWINMVFAPKPHNEHLDGFYPHFS